MGILGELELPIVLTPTGGGPGATQLAAAVSEAGGLGLIRAGHRSTEQLRENILTARAMTSRPFGVDIPLAGGYSADPERYSAFALRLAGGSTPVGFTLGQPRFHDVSFRARMRGLLADPVAVVSLTSGLPPQGVVQDLQRAGSEVWLTVTSADEAREAAALGADALVVQAVQARAARDLDLLATLQLVGSVVTLPLVAASSIVTGAGVAAVLVAGASAAQLGEVRLRSPADLDCRSDGVDAAEFACRLAADARDAIDVAARSLDRRQPRSRP